MYYYWYAEYGSVERWMGDVLIEKVPVSEDLVKK